MAQVVRKPGRPYKGSAPNTFPRGEGGTAPAVTDEECGR